MKTYIWAIIGIAVVGGIFVVTRGRETTTPATDNTPQSSTEATISTSTPASMETPTDDNSHVRADGLGITIIKKGSGAAAKNGDMVTVHYTGRLTNGMVFDSNVDPKFGHVEPFTFALGTGMVIKGWDDGVLGMQVGETRRLEIPSELGYGSRGAGSAIPPNADLIFEVTVTGISHS